jgi:uroporphyrinogen decarboxylase
MENFRVPLKSPKPDIERFLAAMRGEIEPERVPLVEYIIDNSLLRFIVEERLARKWIGIFDGTGVWGGESALIKSNREDVFCWYDNFIAFWYRMGYDFVRMELMPPYPAQSLMAPDTADTDGRSKRSWQKLSAGPIGSWEDFERYPWPEIGESDFLIHRYICDHLPDGMGFISCHAGGIYEHTSRLMGYENLCCSLIERRDLVQAVTDRLGDIILRYNRHLLQLDRLVALFQGDDFGYNTQTLISPDDLRAFFLPWHKKYAGQAHERGRSYFLHSCGKIDEIMEDLIDDVRIDGKHSFMEGVAPVKQAKRRYGDRICLLGGVDMNKLASADPPLLRQYVRSVIDECRGGGRFALGAGNSIPSYIPVVNYLTMIDEAFG